MFLSSLEAIKPLFPWATTSLSGPQLHLQNNCFDSFKSSVPCACSSFLHSSTCRTFYSFLYLLVHHQICFFWFDFFLNSRLTFSSFYCMSNNFSLAFRCTQTLGFFDYYIFVISLEIVFCFFFFGLYEFKLFRVSQKWYFIQDVSQHYNAVLWILPNSPVNMTGLFPLKLI